ncbi:MAG: LytTR family transcriptional regulator DNA-binding domain-containing protein [Bacilli bacterium]
MITFVIVEDNKFYMDFLKETVLKYMMKNKLEFEILDFSKQTKELDDIINNPKLSSIYILDFELPNNVTAIDIARDIRKKDWTSPIIVYSAHGGMAYETFKQRLQILDFVNKQFKSEDSLIELFDICLKQLDVCNSLKINTKSININVPYNRILYIHKDVLERKCIIVTDNGNVIVRYNIRDMLPLLDSRFKVAHKSCIVNSKRVLVYNWTKGYMTMDNNEIVYMLSKRRKKEMTQDASTDALV